jgi:hypothetical protein
VDTPTENTFTGNRTQDSVCVVTFVSVISSSKQLWFWCRSYIMFNFQATETTFTENQTQDIEQEFWPVYVSSGSEEISMPNLVQIDVSFLEL